MKHVFLTLAIVIGCAHQTFSQTYEAALSKSAGLNYITVSINGTNKEFIFDTGAATTTISQQVRDELLANGALQPSDFTGQKSVFWTASGDSVASDEVIIRSLAVGKATLYNVQAVVPLTDNDDVPLLLGQSVMNRMRHYSISKDKLKFELKSDKEQQFLSDIVVADRHLYNDDLSGYWATMSKYIDDEIMHTLSAEDEEYYTSYYAYALYYADRYSEAAHHYQLLCERYGEDEYLYYLARCAMLQRNDAEAVAMLRRVVDNNYEMSDYAMYYLAEYYYINDDSTNFLKYNNALIADILRKHNLTEKDLLTNKYDIELLGEAYYMMAIYERDQWNCDAGIRYKTISENLGYTQN